MDLTRQVTHSTFVTEIAEIAQLMAEASQELINLIVGDTDIDAVYRDAITGEIEVVNIATVEPVN